MTATRSHLALPRTFDNGTFARYVPFGDDRDLVVRRGAEMGRDYGFEVSRREVTVGGATLPLVRYESLLTCGAGTARHDVLRLPDAEVLVPREGHGHGFTDDEVDRILAAITLT